MRDHAIGLVGLGKMGLPIARRLAAAGYEVTVYARNAASGAKATAAGFSTAATMAELGREASVLIMVVPDDEALMGLETAGLSSGLSAESVVIDLSTVSPTASARLAAAIGPTNASFLRSPVSGSTAAAAAGTLTAIVSGPRTAFDAMQPILEAFTAKRFHVGHAEEARYLKLAINSMLGATSALIGEALALGESGGLDRATMLGVILESAVASPLIGYKRDMLVSGDLTAAFSVSQMMKDIDIILSVGRSDHVPLPVNALVRQIYERAHRDGYAEADFFALVEAARGART
jgi:3-hydroxyisobutyrate dehydrogenase-like beta-hydroxyacid dehydrogenase